MLLKQRFISYFNEHVNRLQCNSAEYRASEVEIKIDVCYEWYFLHSYSWIKHFIHHFLYGFRAPFISIHRRIQHEKNMFQHPFKRNQSSLYVPKGLIGLEVRCKIKHSKNAGWKWSGLNEFVNSTWYFSILRHFCGNLCHTDKISLAWAQHTGKCLITLLCKHFCQSNDS